MAASRVLSIAASKIRSAATAPAPALARPGAVDAAVSALPSKKRILGGGSSSRSARRSDEEQVSFDPAPPFPVAEMVAAARRRMAADAKEGRPLADLYIVLDPSMDAPAARAAVASGSTSNAGVEVYLLAGDDLSAEAAAILLAGEDRRAALDLLADSDRRVVDAVMKEGPPPFLAAEMAAARLGGAGKSPGKFNPRLQAMYLLLLHRCSFLLELLPIPRSNASRTSCVP